VRYTLSNINNTTPVFTTPKTKSSHIWIGLSSRAVRALHRQAERQRVLRLAPGAPYRDQDLVFTRHNGQPLRPEYVLRHLHQLASEAGLPRIRVHDLRHFAATTMLSSQVPLATASKTMRHSTLSTTTEVYGHLLRHVAQQAVDAIDTALTLGREPDAGRLTTTMRPPADQPALTCPWAPRHTAPRRWPRPGRVRPHRRSGSSTPTCAVTPAPTRRQRFRR
jgi:integrase-like protein